MSGMGLTWEDFEEWWMVSGNCAKIVFHSRQDCEMIKSPERAVNRSESYVRSHEPTPCYQCHEDVERNNQSPDYDVPALEDHDDDEPMSPEEAGRLGHAARGPPRECTCPKCGQEGIKSLPIHMRACEGEQAQSSD